VIDLLTKKPTLKTVGFFSSVRCALILDKAELLDVTAGNGGTFRCALFSVVRLEKRTALQITLSDNIAAATIQPSASKNCALYY
jgi:hypothetical protein